MLSSKDRQALKHLAQTMKPVFQIGKDGLTPEVLHQIMNYLNKNELGKVSILDNAPESKENIATFFEMEQIEVVQIIGNVITLYRKNPDLTKGIVLPR